MTAKDAAELCTLMQPHTVVPIHYEGWKHFRQGRADAERAFAAAPGGFAEHVRWLDLGAPASLSV
jgi:L-ascorbate metabolism protein UlaG (beta-lactamase superfamily)